MKTWAQYLAEYNNDAAAAAAAMQRDAQAALTQAQADTQTQIRENQQARALAAAFRTVAERAGIDTAPLNDASISAERRRELADGYARQVTDTVTAARQEAEAATGVLTAVGFDVAAWRQAQGDARQALERTFTQGITDTRQELGRTQRDGVLRDAGLDPKRASSILGDVQLVKGTVKDKDGKDVETLGVKNADGSFTPVSKLAEDRGFTLADLTPRTTTTATEQPADAALGFLGGGQAATNTGTGGGGLLDFLTAKPATTTGTTGSQ